MTRRNLLRWLAITFAALTTPACAHEKYSNRYPYDPSGGFGNWLIDQLKDLPPASREELAHIAPVAYQRSINSATPVVTWLGHSSVLYERDNMRILFDPHFGERASPVTFAGPKRWAPAPVNATTLGPIDIVCISHDHFDHLDLPTLKDLHAANSQGIRFLVPAGVSRWLESGWLVEEFEWWQEKTYSSIPISLVPVHHASGRSLWSTNSTLWGGWVVRGDSRPFFFLGDAGYSQDFKDIHKRFGPFSLAALSIGGYEPPEYHLTPEDAVKAWLDLEADSALAIHWGTFSMTNERPVAPLPLLDLAINEARLPREHFHVLRPGESISLVEEAWQKLASV